ncbi:carboxypeptidase-like regulatory domain-containing protein [Hymenobacter latericus]|uniref:carboxypeptidase-like regulatory domain-containing protein n=1 Tax=Hymenobacter sp. YIM 151858-1 TaxID=2987688 RepID=UPI002225DDB2|nr:carboxypeptidase-like regulatory domain-containing protein [Hymenobacter sp. YIM 151858-1]UYZ60322.1 carboxypeptidase-like regulatory domain-containing protein [Hymenobacter sp. YIM 151858-1]
MFRSSLLIFAALGAGLPLQAQQLKGRVVAAQSGSAVAFATVGVKGKPVGTTTDAAGNFVLNTSASITGADSVIISCIGYRACRTTVAGLRSQPQAWELQPVAQPLQEVQVKHGRVRPATLGGKVEKGTAHWNTQTRDLAAVGDDERGWEVATILPVRHNGYIDGFHFYLEDNEFKLVRLRFMLYEVANGKPTKPLLTQDIQFTVPSGQTGWASVDLRQYNLQLHKGQTVAAGIQWLQGEKLHPESSRFGGPGAFPSATHRAVVRDKSEAEWRTFPVNASMYLAVQEYD